MKKFTLFLSLFTFTFSFGQGLENFTNSNASSSYTDNSFSGNSSITWTYVHSRNANGDENSSGISLPALMLRKSSSSSKVTSSSISGGIGNFSVKLYKGFTGGGNRQVEVFVNGVSKGSSTTFNDYNEHTFSVTGINVSGNVIIEIRNITAKQVIVDDITWTAYSNDLSVSSDQTISSDVSYDNVTVNVGNTLTIAKAGSLTISGNLSNNGTVILQSDSNEFASLIVQGTSSGNITYKRYIADEGTNEWDLIGSPVVGQAISNFVSSNSSLADNGSQYAIGVFSNDGSTDTAAAMYTNVTSGDLSGSFTAGIGYAMATDEADTPGTTLDFTGTVNTSNVTVAIDDETATLTNFGKWNLIANPFPSYLNANSATSGTNFVTVNASNLHSTYAYIYGYDGDGTWTAYNNSSGATYIAPGQGLFVASDDSGGNTVSFSEAMQTVSGTDDFISGDIVEDSFELILKLYEGDTEIDYTRFYFEDGLSLGLNPTYDAGHFNQEASLMSRLLEEDQGHGLIINAMGLESINDVVVPLVINQEAGVDFRINIDAFGIYAGTNVYLEDNVQGTMTLLNEEDFELTPENTLSEVGRFYLHLTEGTFSIDEELLTNNLNVYKADQNNFITVEGLAVQSRETSVKLYNVVGMELLSTSLNNNTNTQTISTDRFPTGVYVIKLQSGNNLVTKKLIIK